MEARRLYSRSRKIQQVMLLPNAGPLRCAMLMVRSSPRRWSVVFMVVNLFSTYEEETVGRALVVYAIFSTFAYLVNLLLASRFLPITPAVSLALSSLAPAGAARRPARRGSGAPRRHQ